ncbi:MAG: arginine deiminase family protein [Breznakibacter sp.]
MMTLNIHNETNRLKSVILGIGTSMGEPSKNDPKSSFHMENGTFPIEEDILKEISQFEKVLIDNQVNVIRPSCIDDLCQIFTRDIGFVLGDTFFISAMIQQRQPEIEGISGFLSTVSPSKIVDIRKIDPEIRIEGGDIIVWDDFILVGKSARTNDKGYNFLKDRFRDKKVVQIPIRTSHNHLENVLHLDCALQPVGNDKLILYRDGIESLDGIKSIIDVLEAKKITFDNVVEVNQKQAYRMFPNVFSISKNKVVIEKRFVELKFKLKSKGIEVIEVDYAEVSKLSGLFRCSTLPIERTEL